MTTTTAQKIKDESCNTRETWDKASRYASHVNPGMKDGKFIPQTIFVFGDNSTLVFTVDNGQLTIN